MDKTGRNRIWAKRLALVGVFGSWMVILPVVFNYLTGRDLLYSRYDALMLFSLSLALIGFFSAIEADAAPFKEIIDLRGDSAFMAVCMISSCLMIVGLCLLLITPYFFGVL